MNKFRMFKKHTKPKNNKIGDLYIGISITTLYVNGLKIPIKNRDYQSDYFKSQI